ncbi:ABC transporter permease subunit [Verticiella sediminum]|uniref:ABC transporter permease subunit n=1 Tax=Verticiella sediminum TaxID=1247510 RepID=A0A556ACH2_9BURK|nr:ABC transporter permease subunit [Verticiella sediminum]TSH90594.1 ABC transporter permease subunit [Verticiella sediminum]
MTRPPRSLRSLLALLRALVFPAVLLAAFEWYARSVAAGSDALAPPSAALAAFGRAIQDGSLWQATGFTLGSAMLGLAAGSLPGILLGVVLGLSPRAARTGFLTIEVLRPVPSVALIPLALLIFGFGLALEVSVVAFATFWPMLILAQAAARQVEPRLLEVSMALQLSPMARLCKIVIPAMVPRLFVALRLGVAIALVVAVTVEIAANPHGMGYAIMIAQQSLEPDLMLAWLFWIAVVGFAINAAADWLQRRAMRAMGAGQ